ncbi:GNAT family N-acetyltransferase [Companilactobacillus kimchiensis]|uniref:Acetyltransferase n=1 Tax=Companilactobacillus kimchiensis TaxID=993692 RepID=A0A0R2L9T4_9LACO|nr:GNAT family N-acetyltransferase [Companilactobacillus kimchiensis]KRN98639.1 acetyltransferase [Companilactobacillus kimchiensis]
MIRKMNLNELEKVGQIWLNGNLEAHDFIDRSYWKKHLTEVKQQFLQAEIYVYVDNQIKGFTGLKDDYIAGIFVDKNFRNQGIGKQLLDYLKKSHNQLTLDVYEKNFRARKFYEDNGFNVSLMDVDLENNEKEYHLLWQKSDC